MPPNGEYERPSITNQFVSSNWLVNTSADEEVNLQMIIKIR